MAKLIIIYWRDIPSQVVVRRAGKSEKQMLAPRFQEAIDRAAMRAGKTSSDQYLADWRRESVAATGDPAASLMAHAKRLDQAYTEQDLARLIRSHGIDEALDSPFVTANESAR